MQYHTRTYEFGTIFFFLKLIMISMTLFFCTLLSVSASPEGVALLKSVKKDQLLLEESLTPRKDLAHLINKSFETLRPKNIPGCAGFGRVFLPMPGISKTRSANHFYIECYSTDFSKSGPVLKIKDASIVAIYSKKDMLTMDLLSVGDYPELTSFPSYLAGTYEEGDYQFETKKYTLNTRCIFGDILRVQSPNKTINFNTDFILLQKIEFSYEYKYYPNCPGLIADNWSNNDRKGLLNYIAAGDILKIDRSNYLINDTFILVLDSNFKPKNKEMNIRKIFVKDLISAGLLGYLTNSAANKLPSSVAEGLSRLSLIYNRAAN